MASDDSVITYHDDGSKKKGGGSFMVQGVTINGKFRAFPTLPIASESKDNRSTGDVNPVNEHLCHGNIKHCNIIARPIY